MNKIPAYKRLIRVIKILIINIIFFPIRYKKFKDLINYIYQYNPYPKNDLKNIKEVELYDIFPSIRESMVILKDIEFKYGSMTLSEMYSILLLIKYFKPKRIFEFGTFIGVTTLQIALNIEDDAKIYTLNLSSVEEKTKYSIGNSDAETNLPSLKPGERFKKSNVEKKVVQLFGDSATFDYSNYIDKIDFILIDASHEYEYVKSDTINAFKMIKQNGIIIWHDYPNSPGVYKFLNLIADEIKIFHLKDTHIAFTYNINKKIINSLPLS